MTVVEAVKKSGDHWRLALDNDWQRAYFRNQDDGFKNLRVDHLRMDLCQRAGRIWQADV
jgi:hypothetical protein